MCIIHDKLMFAQKELCLRGNPRLLTECTKDREDCFVVSALSSKYQTRDSRVPAPFPGPLHFISRGCTDKNRCESMCDELNITSPMRGSIFRCNVTCCSTSYCTETLSPLVCGRHLEITEPVRKNIFVGSPTVTCRGNRTCISLSVRASSQLKVRGHPTVSASFKGPYDYNYQGCGDRDGCLNLCQRINSTLLRVKGSALSCTQRCCTTDKCNTRIAAFDVSDKFKCKSGRYLPLSWRCDRLDDCGDGSDERDSPSPTTGTDFNTRHEDEMLSPKIIAGIVSAIIVCLIIFVVGLQLWRRPTRGRDTPVPHEIQGLVM